MDHNTRNLGSLDDDLGAWELFLVNCSERNPDHRSLFETQLGFPDLFKEIASLLDLEALFCVSCASPFLYAAVWRHGITSLQFSYKTTYSRAMLYLDRKPSALTEVDLGGLSVNRPLLHSLGQLKNMITLHLSSCTHLSDNLFGELTGLQALTQLDVSSCDSLGEGFFDHLVALKNLKVLVMSYCLVPSEKFSVLSNLKKLHSLHIGYSKFVNERALQCISDMTQLTSLDLTRCEQIKGPTACESLAKLIRLRYLLMNQCVFPDDEGIQKLSTLTILNQLAISFARKVSNEGLINFSSFQNLHTLSLGSDLLTNKCFPHFCNLKKVISLEIRDIKFEKDGGMLALGLMTQLTSLFLRDMKIPTSDSLVILTALTNLQKLDLDFCRLGEGVLQYLSHLRHLDFLNLGYCEHVQDEDLRSISALTTLTYLDLRYSEELTTTNFSCLVPLQNLVSLDIGRCRLLNVLCIPHLQKLTSLIELDLNFCGPIPEDDLQTLSASLRLLTSLNQVKIDRSISQSFLVQEASTM